MTANTPRAGVRGAVRYLPTPVQSAVGIAALTAIVAGAAAQRRRHRAAAGREPTLWATSGSTGGPKDRDER